MVCARSALVLAGAAVVFVCVGCAQEPTELRAVVEETLVTHPANDLVDLVAGSAAELDSEVTSDGGGSLRISVSQPTTVALYETGDLDIENARLIYRAKLRSADLEGRAYLEMWCSFAEAGDYFSRGLDSAISGTVEWCTRETAFILQPGQNPDDVRLNLVVDGSGTVWVDEIEVLKAPLRKKPN